MDDVEKLGTLGDVVEVKKGYARNYLFPRNLAIEAMDKNLRVLEAKKRKRAQLIARHKAELEALAEKISNMSCTVPMSAGEEDRLFGSVTTAQISEAFAAEGVQIDKRQIVMPEEPIKRLGVYQIEVKLHPEVTASTKVWVVRK